MCQKVNGKSKTILVNINGDDGITIDSCLTKMVIELNGSGFKTYWCCCGHEMVRTPPYISFERVSTDKLAMFVDIVLKHKPEWKRWYLYVVCDDRIDKNSFQLKFDVAKVESISSSSDEIPEHPIQVLYHRIPSLPFGEIQAKCFEKWIH